MTDHDDNPDTPHDVLAAEEFGMGVADPALHVEPPHDVLAADEFGVGSADPALHPGPITVPSEPGAGPGARDVLAADEFAVPAGPARADEREHDKTIAVGPRGLLGLAGAAVVVLAARRRRRRR